MRKTYFDKLKKQGAVEAMQKVLSRQLQTKFGPLPEVVIDKIRKIESEDELTKIAENFVTASSLSELGLDKS